MSIFPKLLIIVRKIRALLYTKKEKVLLTARRLNYLRLKQYFYEMLIQHAKILQVLNFKVTILWPSSDCFSTVAHSKSEQLLICDPADLKNIAYSERTVYVRHSYNFHGKSHLLTETTKGGGWSGKVNRATLPNMTCRVDELSIDLEVKTLCLCWSMDNTTEYNIVQRKL